jgi:S-adenosylmethionine decarboxylase
MGAVGSTRRIGFGRWPFRGNGRRCSRSPGWHSRSRKRAEKEVNRLHALGTHLLLELRDCNPKTLSNLEFVQESLKNAALEAKATIVEVAFHEFSPFGISGMVVIAESHLAIHTWPEYGYAAVDVFTCGDLIDPKVAAKFLIEKFQSKNPSIIEMKRGILGHEKLPHKALPGETLKHDRAQELQVVH